jgi:HD-GYP domain-containing protein (c-di-GMP phosphodiesterase class II)
MAGLVFTYLRRANAGSGMLGMIAGVARGLITGKAASEENISGHCEVAERLAERLSLSEGVRRNLGQIYERWDGQGLPRGLKGEAIAPAVRVVSFAQDAIVLRAAYGVEAAHEKLEARAGSAYEPRLVERYLKRAEELTAGLDETSWEDVLALEPQPHTPLSPAEFDAACLAMADYADLKSPYSVGHSRAVSTLAAEAARRCGLPEADATDLARAGLLHDIGQVAVPARIWLKPGALNDSEWEQVRLHSYYGERVLARPGALARLGAIVAQHHERLDGSGYPAGLAGGISVDQAIANSIGGGTKLKSLELGVEAGSTGTVWGYSAYSGANQPLPPDNNPVAVWNRVFADLGADNGGLARLRRSRGATVLAEPPVGRTVEILCVYEKDPKFLEFLDERGLRPGVRMRVLHREYDETTTVAVGGRKVYLGKPATSRIWGRAVSS